MTKWFFSLQFRFIAAFAFVLMLALVAVGSYSALAAEREKRSVSRAWNEASIARIHEAFTEYYSNRGNWIGVASTVDRVSYLTGRDISVQDRAGNVIAATALPRKDERAPKEEQAYTSSRIVVDDNHVGTVLIGPIASRRTFRPFKGPGRLPSLGEPSGEIREPSLDRFTDTAFRSLLFSGLGAGAGGILLISLLSRRMLGSVRRLTAAAQELGKGDLSQRVAVSGRDEIGELTSTFNAMAEGLESAERQRRHMVADVAHELRTPLTNIRGYVEAMRDGLLEADEKTIQNVHQQTMYLAKLVDDLRLLAETEAGEFQLDSEPAVLAEVIARSVDAFRPQAQAKGIDLVFASSPDSAQTERRVEIDRMRIEQVMNNLLQNAVTHTPNGGRIDVVITESHDSVSVAVADTGEGIPSEELPNVFDRLHRVDPSRARSTGGAGLGLTIAKQLIEAHGGTIRAESTPGEGSTLTFSLPLP